MKLVGLAIRGSDWELQSVGLDFQIRVLGLEELQNGDACCNRVLGPVPWTVECCNVQYSSASTVLDENARGCRFEMDIQIRKSWNSLLDIRKLYVKG